MQDRHVDDLLEAYVLGALEPTDMESVERHLEQCATCRALAEQLRRLADMLLTSAPQAAPPPSLRAKVLARVAREREEAIHPAQPNRARRSRSPEQSWSLARMLRSLFGSAVPEEEGAHAGEVLRALLAEPDTSIWEVGGTEAAPGASARLIGSRSRRDAVLVTNGLPPPASGQAYQVWFLSSGRPLPNALFTVDRAGQGTSVLRARAPLGDYDTVAVTTEPLGGSPAPTGPIVLAGELRV